MAKRSYIPLSERIGSALEASKARIKRQVARSIDYVYDEGNKSVPYIAAYERVLAALAGRVTDSKINVKTLERIAVSLERGVSRKAGTAESGFTKGDYCKLREAGKTYDEIREKHPRQDIRWMEGYYNRTSGKIKK